MTASWPFAPGGLASALGGTTDAGRDSCAFRCCHAAWRDLALRRHAYYVELFKSGRWTRYFTEQEFIERMRDVMDDDGILERPCGEDGLRRPGVRGAGAGSPSAA